MDKTNRLVALLAKKQPAAISSLCTQGDPAILSSVRYSYDSLFTWFIHCVAAILPKPR